MYDAIDLKTLTLKRQKAFNTNGADSVLFKYGETKACESRFCKFKIQQMKGKTQEDGGAK